MHSFLTIPRVCVAAVLTVCVALPGVIWARNGLPETNPGQPFDGTSAQITIMNDTMQDVPGRDRTESCDGPPVWRKKFSGSGRFVAVLNGAAYCDQKTGIVWEASPAGSAFDWAGSINHCTTREVGARKGWSLPMREQLASLADTNSGLCTGGGLCLPDGHPFQNVQSSNYWSASTTGGSPAFAWVVNFFFGGVLVINLDGNALAWCAR